MRFLLLVIMMLLGPPVGFGSALRVENGRLDLMRWNFAQSPIPVLEGDWEFFWFELLDPQTIQGRDPPEYFPMPSNWSKRTGGCCGYASFRARIRVPPEESLAIEIPYMSTATKVWINGVEFFKSGQIGTSADTSVPSRQSIIKALPQAEEIDIIMQISNYHHARGGAWRAPRIGRLELINREVSHQQLFDMAIIGGIWAIGIYHLALFMLRKEKISIAFSLCCFAVGVRLSSVGSRILENLIDSISWSTMFRIEYLTLYLSAPMIWLYVQQLFPEEVKKSWMSIAMAIFAFFVISTFLPPLFFTKLINGFHIIVTTVSITLLFVVLRSVALRRTAAKTIAAGGVAIIMAAIFDITNMLFFNKYQAFYFHIGFLFFTICQSFAIAQIYNQYYINLQREESMRRHSYNQLAKVFYPHQLQMMQAGKPLEQTMPTGQSSACVLAFDVVGSSRIEHIDVKAFLESSIKRCLSVISEGYNGEELTATGYRIKEIGDGFLCSVGFPFKTPSNENIAIASVRLAMRFVDIFHEEVRNFAYGEPIHCCIGIAYDSIEGYFPSTGTREYDVYGRSVILATRYEGMRRMIFPDGVPHSLIIVQRRVWKSLGVELQQQFKAFDLEASGMTVRDDKGAKNLYYALIPVDSRSHLKSA